MVSEAIKLEREKRKTDREARLWALLSDPLTLAVLTTAAGVWGAEHMKWSEDQSRDSKIRVAIEAAVLYAALTRVGAKGWPAAVAALGGGVALGAGSSTPYSPLQAGEATVIGAGLGSVVPGVGTIVGAGVGFGIDAIYQMVT